MTYMKRLSDDPNDPDYILKDGEIIKDGRVLRVPLMMMDGLQHAMVDYADSARRSTHVADGLPHRPGPVNDALPGGVTVDFSARDAAYAGYLKDLTDGWRRPPPDVTAIAKATVSDARTESREAYEAWLRDAWRNP